MLHERPVDVLGSIDAVRRRRARRRREGEPGVRRQRELDRRLLEVDGTTLAFKDDLAARLDAADGTYNRINASIDAWIEREGIDAPPAEPYVPTWVPEPGPSSIDLVADEVRTVIWATGFRPNWAWVDLPFLDETGYPAHDRGISTRVPGLHLLGLPWLHTWGSGRFASIDRDARHLITHVAARASTPA